jgi:hypothetical protein
MANNDFSAEGRLKNLPDLHKSWLWELYIELPSGIAGDGLSTDELLLRVRNVMLPGKTITPIETYFMGTKTFHPGKMEFSGQLSVQLEEYEDQKVHDTLNAWADLIFNWETGKQGAALKSDITSTGILKMYKSNGEPMPKMIKIFNMYPASIPDVTLDYAGTDPVRYDVQFQYDWWKAVQSQ